MRLLLLSIILIVTTVSAEFGTAGSMEAGGRFSFSSIDLHDAASDRGHSILVEPLFNWYFKDQLYLASKVNLHSETAGTWLGLGAGVGYAFPVNAPVIPYIDGGVQYIYSSYVDKSGLAFPFSGGAKISLYRNVSLDFNGYITPAFINSEPGVDVGFSGGVTILIFP